MHAHCGRWMLAICAVIFMASYAHAQRSLELRGRVIDAATGAPLAARVYVHAADKGLWYFAQPATGEGQAIRYRKQRGRQSSENHATLSAHPFTVNLPPGEYIVTVERGKDYKMLEKTVFLRDKPVPVDLKLQRWIDMAGRGWYSGDTHVHRTLEELPLLVESENLNVALPLTDWVTASHQPPRGADDDSSEPKLIEVDPTHVIYPRNTEYEIFSVGNRRHTLGAFFVLGHKTRFTKGVPPVRPIAEQARREGALLELDKHSWPWSLMLVPEMKVDLFELLNNHVWRTEFGMDAWSLDTVPEGMKVERNQRGLTEWGWIDYGLRTYYALLNCGFRMRPTAGTASGVHPVPLGFSRVYVYLPEKFSYAAWMKGLDAGRSFVTNGPMLMVRYNDQYPGHTFADLQETKQTCRITGTAEGSQPIGRVEIVVNGRVVKYWEPDQEKTKHAGYTAAIDETVQLEGSSWVAVRCFEKHHAGRIRIAHTGPVYFDVAGRPLRPRQADVDHFIARIKAELARNTGVLSDAELGEYRRALATYEKLRQTAQ